MKTTDSPELLTAMLGSATVDLLRPRAGDVELIWAVWGAFTLIPADDLGRRAAHRKEDALLVRYGMGSDGRFALDLLRQYVHRTAVDEPPRVERLHCTLSFPREPALAALPAWELWNHDLHRRDFRARVEASRGFRALVDGTDVPLAITVELRPA